MHRILVADDEPFILRSLAFTLRQEGFRVITATNGQEALDALQHDNIDCAFLDIMMPKLSGFDVLQQLRDQHGRAPCPVIFLTAKGMDGDRERAMALNVDAYVTKPFSPSAIIRLVRQTLGINT
jgi:CheY-like chemotaxis protein